MRTVEGMHIVQVITRMDRGGSAASVRELCVSLRDKGYRVSLVTGETVDPVDGYDRLSAQHGVEVHVISRLRRNISPRNDLAAFVRLFFLFRRLRPDIVHTHTSKAGILGRWAAFCARVPGIVHSPRGHVFYGYYGRSATGMFILAERLAAGITDSITTLTETGRKEHIRYRIAPPGKFRVVHSGVDTGPFVAARRNREQKHDVCTVGWAGRLAAVKKCSLFIDAAAGIYARRPEARFLVAGEGEERGKLERRAEQAGLGGSLAFLGHRNDMPAVMASFDVLILTSDNEGFGRVLVEAMAAGAVPVATAVGGTMDVIEDDVSGILVPPRDATALVNAVIRLMDDTKLMARLRENAVKRAEMFSLDNMVEKLAFLYQDLCPERGSKDR